MDQRLPEFLVNMIIEQYGQEIADKIINGYKCTRKVSLRVNTIKSNIDKVKEELSKKSIEFQDVTWNKDALILNNANEKLIQELDIYKNGEIYMQSLSSMLPPIILEPEPNIDILDMAAAPGGKTTQIAALSKNEAHITACKINAIRLERLKYNIDKQGATCVYVMKKDARTIDDFFSFDKILLDAPCSGSGTLDIKDINLKKKFTSKLIEKSVSSQIALLKKAIKILKKGGELVYSTCSILAQENEDILEKVLKGTNAQIVPITLEDKGIPILPVKIKGTVCVCPNELYEGFFIAKIMKV